MITPGAPRGWLFVLAICAAPAAIRAENWPGWRGPRGDGVSRETGLPVQWSATKNVRWKAPLSGAGVSNPVVWGDRVFLTSADGRDNDRPHVLCFHADDGRLLWKASFFGTALSDGQFAPGGMAVPTPATDGRHVWALFGTGDLVCLDMDGKPVWVRSLAQEYGPFRNRWGMASSPLLVNGLLVVQVDHWADSYLLAVDAATGANRWRAPREMSIGWASPVAIAVGGKTQVVAAGNYAVRGYDLATGAEVWSIGGMEMQCVPTPVPQGDRLYIGCTKGHQGMAVRLDGARGELSAGQALWKARRKGAFVPSPIVVAGHYYFVDDNGIGNCLDAASGEEVWRERLGGKYSASPLAGDGKVYFTNEDGVVTVVKAGPKFELLAKNPIGERVIASPAAAGGRIYLRGDKHLYCIGER
jgi:outer membrane protein assembly factor BamB